MLFQKPYLDDGMLLLNLLHLIVISNLLSHRAHFDLYFIVLSFVLQETLLSCLGFLHIV